MEANIKKLSNKDKQAIGQLLAFRREYREHLKSKKGKVNEYA